jgi:hypothetical protein
MRAKKKCRFNVTPTVFEFRFAYTQLVYKTVTFISGVEVLESYFRPENHTQQFFYSEKYLLFCFLVFSFYYFDLSTSDASSNSNNNKNHCLLATKYSFTTVPPLCICNLPAMFSVKFMVLTAVVMASSLCSVQAGGHWVDSPENKRRAEEKTPRAPKEFIVNLDLPKEERWKEIGAQYADKSFLLVEYLRRNLPRGWLKPIEAIAGKILPFFQDYGEEMHGYAEALNITDGDVVSINLIYQLERLGLSCDSWNNTGT